MTISQLIMSLLMPHFRVLGLQLLHMNLGGGIWSAALHDGSMFLASAQLPFANLQSHLEPVGVACAQCSMDLVVGGMGRRAMQSFTEARKLTSFGPQVPRANSLSLVTTRKKSVC